MWAAGAIGWLFFRLGRSSLPPLGSPESAGREAAEGSGKGGKGKGGLGEQPVPEHLKSPRV